MTDQCLLLFTDDFFRFGFDGSGADNYFDAGSCIDGRLTSAWNCKFPYYSYVCVRAFDIGITGLM